MTDLVHHNYVTTANCKNCKSHCAWVGTAGPGHGECFVDYVPQTNADLIRAMRDEEMAIEMTAKGGCPHDCEEPENMDTDCVKCWLDWLKQEVKG